MSDRPPRKRIVLKKKGIPAIMDELAFVKNKCSEHARCILTTSESLYLELWFDKHYHDRFHHGDDEGKRVGIDPKKVEALLKKSIKHLLFYSSAVKGFKFINYDYFSEPPMRILLQEEADGEMLNVAIETHSLGVDKFEITVNTAMCTREFKIAAGQYCIEFQSDTSILKKFDNKKLIEICSI